MTTQPHLPPQALRLMMLPSPCSDPLAKYSGFKSMAPSTATMRNEGKDLMKDGDLIYDLEEEEGQGWMNVIVRKSYTTGTDVQAASAPASLSSFTGEDEEWSEDEQDDELEFEDFEEELYMGAQVGRSAPVPIPGAGKGRSRKLEDFDEDNDLVALMLETPSMMYRTDFAGNRCTQTGVWLTPEGYVLPGKPEQVRCAQRRHSNKIVDFC